MAEGGGDDHLDRAMLHGGDSPSPNTRPPEGGQGGQNGGFVCRMCGWRFPNPRPSAKQRRAHRKHCGGSEGHYHPFRGVASNGDDGEYGDDGEDAATDTGKILVAGSASHPDFQASNEKEMEVDAKLRCQEVGYQSVDPSLTEFDVFHQPGNCHNSDPDVCPSDSTESTLEGSIDNNLPSFSIFKHISISKMDGEVCQYNEAPEEGVEFIPIGPKSLEMPEDQLIHPELEVFQLDIPVEIEGSLVSLSPPLQLQEKINFLEKTDDIVTIMRLCVGHDVDNGGEALLPFNGDVSVVSEDNMLVDVFKCPKLCTPETCSSSQDENFLKQNKSVEGGLTTLSIQSEDKNTQSNSVEKLSCLDVTTYPALNDVSEVFAARIPIAEAKNAENCNRDSLIAETDIYCCHMINEESGYLVAGDQATETINSVDSKYFNREKLIECEHTADSGPDNTTYIFISKPENTSNIYEDVAFIRKNDGELGNDEGLPMENAYKLLKICRENCDFIQDDLDIDLDRVGQCSQAEEDPLLCADLINAFAKNNAITDPDSTTKQGEFNCSYTINNCDQDIQTSDFHLDRDFRSQAPTGIYVGASLNNNTCAMHELDIHQELSTAVSSADENDDDNNTTKIRNGAWDDLKAIEQFSQGDDETQLAANTSTEILTVYEDTHVTYGNNLSNEIVNSDEDSTLELTNFGCPTNSNDLAIKADKFQLSMNVPEAIDTYYETVLIHNDPGNNELEEHHVLIAASDVGANAMLIPKMDSDICGFIRDELWIDHDAVEQYCQKEEDDIHPGLSGSAEFKKASEAKSDVEDNALNEQERVFVSTETTIIEKAVGLAENDKKNFPYCLDQKNDYSWESSVRNLVRLSNENHSLSAEDCLIYLETKSNTAQCHFDEFNSNQSYQAAFSHHRTKSLAVEGHVTPSMVVRQLSFQGLGSKQDSAIYAVSGVTAMDSCGLSDSIRYHSRSISAGQAIRHLVDLDSIYAKDRLQCIRTHNSKEVHAASPSQEIFTEPYSFESALSKLRSPVSLTKSRTKRVSTEIQSIKLAEADSPETPSGKPHTPLKSLLVEANLASKLKPQDAEAQNVPPIKRHHAVDNEVEAVKIPQAAVASQPVDGRVVQKEWNSPARLPIDKHRKAKLKGKPQWVPFMCCSYVI